LIVSAVMHADYFVFIFDFECGIFKRKKFDRIVEDDSQTISRLWRSLLTLMMKDSVSFRWRWITVAKVIDYDAIIFDFERDIFKRTIFSQLYLYKDLRRVSEKRRYSVTKNRFLWLSAPIKVPTSRQTAKLSPKNYMSCVFLKCFFLLFWKYLTMKNRSLTYSNTWPLRKMITTTTYELHRLLLYPFQCFT
jgi:hypothetical protein